MKRHLTLMTMTCALTTAFAPPRAGADDLDQAREEAAQAQRRADELQRQSDSQVYSYRKSQEEVATAAERFNGQVRVVRNEGQFLDIQTRIANNVLSYRKKDEFDKSLAKMREELGVTEDFGYRRIREVNGLDGSSYQRFYDNDGYLQVNQFRDYYNGLQRGREDWAKEQQRAAAAADQVEKQYQDLVRQFGSVAASQSAAAGAQTEAQRRVDRLQSLTAQREAEVREQQRQEAERLRQLSPPPRTRGPID